MEAAPLCTHAGELRQLDGRTVRLVGTYLAVPTLKKMPRPGHAREEVQLGEVVIVLAGRAAAYDPTAPDDAPAHITLGDGPRPPDEIAAFGGRRVEVDGRLALAPHGEAAAASPRAGASLLGATGLHLAE